MARKSFTDWKYVASYSVAKACEGGASKTYALKEVKQKIVKMKLNVKVLSDHSPYVGQTGIKILGDRISDIMKVQKMLGDYYPWIKPSKTSIYTMEEYRRWS